MTKKSAFQKLVRVKYQFPADIVAQKREWLQELQKPLNITVNDITRDLRDFVNGFPTERIPHSTKSDVHLKNERTRYIKAILAGEDALLHLDPDDIESPGLVKKTNLVIDTGAPKKKEYGTSGASLRNLN